LEEALMRHQFFMRVAIPSVLVLGASLVYAGYVRVSAQQHAVDKATGSVPRTPWGSPDLTGIWGLGYVFTTIERPDEFKGKPFLTDQEVRALEQAQRERGGDGTGGKARGQRGTVADVDGAYNQAFSQAGQHERVLRTRRTSLVIDPPDGRIPFTAEGRKRAQAAAFLGGDEDSEKKPGQVIPQRTSADGPEGRPADRCIGVVVPFVKRAGTFSRIIQGRNSIGIFMEDGLKGTAYRVIPLDGRSHLPSHLRLWLGDSVGRWESDTLVVDTTNFTDKSMFQGASDKLHLVERFTREAPDMLMYRITLTDPVSYSRPWTMELPLTLADNRKNQIYEGACHEGNYSMATILAGARLLEKEGAVFKDKRP
jgi:hypothetical protein